MEQKKEMKIGIVGCGMISRYHALAVQETEGISLTGCCSHSYESACALAKEFSITAWESYEDMLADGSLAPSPSVHPAETTPVRFSWRWTLGNM